MKRLTDEEFKAKVAELWEYLNPYDDSDTDFDPHDYNTVYSLYHELICDEVLAACRIGTDISSLWLDVLAETCHRIPEEKHRLIKEGKWILKYEKDVV